MMYKITQYEISDYTNYRWEKTCLKSTFSLFRALNIVENLINNNYTQDYSISGIVRKELAIEPSDFIHTSYFVSNRKFTRELIVNWSEFWKDV